MKGSRKGFTLIELLVVIAIIAILAAILFPVFTSARMAGQKAKCVSNFKQIHAAEAAYASDWGDKYVTALNHLGWNGLAWWDRLKPYVAARLTNKQGELMGVFVCPSQPRLLGDPPQGPDPNDPLRRPYLMRSYGTNYLYRYDTTNNKDAMPAGTIPVPSRTVLISEAWCITTNRGSAVSFAPSNQPINTDTDGSIVKQYILPLGLHGGQSNILWFDGHVSSMATARPKVPMPANTAPANWRVGVMSEKTDKGLTCINRWYRLDSKKDVEALSDH